LIEAAAWYRKAAENGDATAQCYRRIGNIYDLFGTEIITQADIWLRKSAGHANLIDLHEVPAILIILDNPYAQLGVLYEDGKDLPADYSQAAFWFAGAQSKGTRVRKLAPVSLFRTETASPGLCTGGAWFRKAPCQENMRRIQHRRTLLSRPRRSADYREAEKMAQQRLADQEMPLPLYNLGTMYAKARE